MRGDSDGFDGGVEVVEGLSCGVVVGVAVKPDEYGSDGGGPPGPVGASFDVGPRVFGYAGLGGGFLLGEVSSDACGSHGVAVEPTCSSPGHVPTVDTMFRSPEPMFGIWDPTGSRMRSGYPDSGANTPISYPDFVGSVEIGTHLQLALAGAALNTGHMGTVMGQRRGGCPTRFLR